MVIGLFLNIIFPQTFFFLKKKSRTENGLQGNQFLCIDIWCKHDVSYNIHSEIWSGGLVISRKFLLNWICDTWPKSNVVLSETCSARLERERVALSYIVDFMLLQSFDCSIYFSIKTSWQKIFFSVPTGEYECHKGLCTKKLSSVQTFCHWSNASQPNLKGNQLLWDHILLFKPWHMIWEKNAQIFNQLDLDFQECFLCYLPSLSVWGACHT